MAEIASGTVVDGRYKVISRLGSGGMADVYLAEDQQLGRKVALKLLHRRFAEDPGFVERFRREAQAAAGLQHPNVVSVYDRGTYDGTYYIAMEYLAGQSLKQLIRQEAPIDPVRAIDITVQILKAARFAHRRGVIHRDLKPHNVIVDDSGHAKVTDFGIARAGASDMTETGSIMGTAQYLSPEQAQGHAVSAGSDLYSIGVVLYELLTGRVPFDAEAAVTIALKHVSESPRPPSSLNPSVPPELEQVVLWALNKNPADRPTDADQFVAVLEQARAAIIARQRGQRTTSFAALAAVGAPAAGVVAGAMAASPAAEAAAPEDTRYNGDGVGVGSTQPPMPPEYRRRRRWPWVAAIVVLLLAAGGAAAYLLTRPVTKIVPTVVLENAGTAQARIENAGLTPTLNYLTDSHPAGTVIRQDPLGGAKAKEGSIVTLTVSQGPGNTTVPPVDGLSKQAAEKAISRAHLKVTGLQSQSSEAIPDGDAVGTDPQAGTQYPVGGGVTLILSSGAPLVTVPDVTNLTEADAKNTLENRGFVVDTSRQPSSNVPAGSVVSQAPSGGSSEPSGSIVTIVVATAPPPPSTVTVPNVGGDSEAAATNALTSAGFQITIQTQSTSQQSKDGIVLSQNPGGGTSAKKGTTVTVVVGKFLQSTSSSTSTSTTTTSKSSTSTPSTSRSTTTTT
ncbi:MAG: Stk1 family PASTA domain-containing Ser/Thr kinase [Solirubrobacterales bacterium]|nr:Stk1 family PASTA domain-containing Ser/Thr kinase [Solirubrobacterales bacterium]